MSGTRSKCPFCLIEQGAIPASTIFESDDFIVLMDAYPLTKGHVLVVPKTHVATLAELPVTQQTELFEIGRRVMHAQRNAGYGIGGINLLLNDGKDANQTVPHVHLHLIPRARYDFLRSLPKLALHITGLFGLQTKRATLDEQARNIKRHWS